MVAALVVAGLAWIAVFSSLNASAQMLLPDWARARGLSYYQLMFQGGQALGAVVWGALARRDRRRADVRRSSPPAGGHRRGAGRRCRLVAREIDLTPGALLAGAAPRARARARAGPVLVVVEWHVAAGRRRRRSARRCGPSSARAAAPARGRWGLFQDGADPTRFLETFTVATWEEHLRQREERMTVRDRELEQAAIDLAIDRAPPQLRHLLSV